MYVSIFFSPAVQNGFHWCLVLEVCSGSSQMNLILMHIGCAACKAQTEFLNFPRRVGT